ncbi:hypothetical protein HFO21_33970 [Rhizobium laguerreae]|uniref:DUF6998 domain-containing protein n=1 Tax=Rhizobium TaxID=379 RepID=UPI001C913B8B|nr:hypothetical protein [Rhizobium laguerreae]MBY3219309.1 hypothetical protein [Rhizobium laguerreae]
MFFKLPSVIKDLVVARDRVRDHYSVSGVDFTFDGKLVGDVGEVVAAKIFGITLTPGGGIGIDGYVGDQENRRSVQIKATNRGGGPAFRKVESRADFLIFLDFKFDHLVGEVVFNGPEHIALQNLPEGVWKRDQMTVAKGNIRRFNGEVRPEQRLPIVDWSLIIHSET